jgi:signal transduction histidine kinase/CheY-like chemotaxis protein
MTSVRILIADDHELVRQGLRALLATRPAWEVCGEAADGREAIEKAEQLKPDVVLLDVSMPRLGGLEAAAIIRRQSPQAAIVIVSQHDAAEMLPSALRAGARGFVSKSELSRDLLATIESLISVTPERSAAANDAQLSAQPPRVAGGAPALEARLATLRELTAALRQAPSAVQACALAVQTLVAQGSCPFALLYLVDEAQQRAQLAASAGAEAVLRAAPAVLSLDGDAPQQAPLARMPAAVVLPLRARERDASLGLLIAGCGAHAPTDADFRNFLELAAAQLGAVIAAAQDEQLARAHQRLRTVTVRMLQLQEEDRRRIARDLHDGAGQALAALSMSLASLGERAAGTLPQLAGAFDSSQELVQQATRDLRTASYLLYPPLLDETGLSGALRWHVAAVARRSGMTVTLEMADDFPRLVRELEAAVFHLVHEGLMNVERHAGSASARVRLAHTADRLSLEIADAGRGIPAERLRELDTQSSAVGIAGMRERVHHFRGTLSISSTATGTRLSATLPLLAVPEASPG